MLKRLLHRKAMDQFVADREEPEHRLKKTLGPVDVTAIGIGGIIGAGIFATIGTAAAGDPTRPGAGPVVFNVLAFGIVALITIVLVIGIRESATTNTMMVLLKLVVLGFFVLVGWSYTKLDNFHPFLPNGWAGVHTGAAIVFFAYIGFDAVSTVAEETRDPARNMPIGIIGSLVISTIIYIVVAAVFTGIVPYNVLRQKLATEQAEPLTMALQYANIQKWGNLFVGIVAFGSVVAHTAVLLVFQLGQPRIFFSMARDGLLPKSFAKVHPRFRTPHVTTILTGVAVAVCAMFTSIDEMVDLTNIGTLFAFILVCVGFLILRKREPHRPRAFKTPWVPLVPILGVISCLNLMRALPSITWIRFGLWLIVGMVVYFFYGFRRSRL